MGSLGALGEGWQWEGTCSPEHPTEEAPREPGVALSSHRSPLGEAEDARNPFLPCTVGHRQGTDDFQ